MDTQRIRTRGNGPLLILMYKLVQLIYSTLSLSTDVWTKL